VEDGAVLGRLFEKITHADQLGDILTIFEAIRKPRTSAIIKGSLACQKLYHLHDGPIQKERDRQLLEEEPFEGYPFRWKDPWFQKSVYGYNAFEEADRGWQKYMSGQFPLTSSAWRYQKSD
jgi:salicylate hydroxylase